jgi:serine/threonine protein kinase
LKPDNILVGIEDSSVIQEMVDREKSDPAPTKQVADGHVVSLSRNFGDLRGIPTEPKISDFGLAVTSPGPHYHPIQPDLFQAPEVILNAGWSFPADVWNLGVMVRSAFLSCAAPGSLTCCYE